MLAFMIVLGRDTWLLWTSIRSFMVLLAPLLLRFLLVLLILLLLLLVKLSLQVNLPGTLLVASYHCLPFNCPRWYILALLLDPSIYVLTHNSFFCPCALSQFQLASPENKGVIIITVLHCVIRIRGSPLRTMICSQRFWACEWSLMDLKHTRYNIILSGYFSIGASAWLPSIKQGDFSWSPTASKGRLRSEISLSSAIGACGQGNAWQARPNEMLRLGSGWVGCIYIYVYIYIIII